jgi:hypothetical protein
MGPDEIDERKAGSMRSEQFKGIYEQVGPAVIELFNQSGGMQPMLLWVKLQEDDDTMVQAAGQVAAQEAVTRLFKEGVAQELLPVMVRDLLESASVPEELGGGGIDAVVVVGETSVNKNEGSTAVKQDALGIWVHSRERTEWSLLPIEKCDEARTCTWREMEVSESGRRGRMTMCP